MHKTKLSPVFMATTEKYITVVELNSEQAKRNLDELRKKVESWKSDLAEAREKKMGRQFISAIKKELKDAEKELSKYDSEVARTIDTLGNLGSASVEKLEAAQKSLKRLASQVPQDSPFFNRLNEQLDQVTNELENIKATKVFEQMQREADGTARSAARAKAEMEFIRQTAENASTASVKQLQLAERTAESIRNSSERGSDEWNEASSHLERIKTRLSEIEEIEKKNVTLIDRYNQELKKTDDLAKQVVSEEQLIDRTMKNLSAASVRDIEYSIKALNEQLRNIDRNDPKVMLITNRLKELNKELLKVQDMQRGKKSGLSISGMWDSLNRNWGAITQVMGAITGLSASVRQSVQQFAEMEEAMADTRKYTGLTEIEVRKLNDTFKQMDTRTSRDQLNALAGVAGRLGITSSEEIKQCVEAADMIGVALGDDLGEGAIDNVGKLAMAFGEDEKMGLRGAMLATGSAINELAQNSAANAGYLVDFTARVAGVGKQLGLTQAQIMGFGAVMDENLLRDEMASTAFSQLLTKMATDTKTFATIAGKDVKEFSDLVRNDMNGAILALMDNIKSKDFETMGKMFDDMGLDGTRAIGVLTTMADKIEDVRKHQKTAIDAYAEGRSVISEFNVMNDTAQANLDKAKNRFRELSVELGNRLLPVVRYTVSAGGLLVKALTEITKFAFTFRREITVVASAVIAYNAVMAVHWIWQKRILAAEKAELAIKTLHTTAVKAQTVAYAAYNLIVAKLQGNVGRAAAAQRMLNGAMSANVVGAVVAVVTTLVAVIAQLTKEMNRQSEAAVRMREVNRELNDRLIDERMDMQELIKVVQSETASEEMRREALEKINGKLMDQHLDNLTEEEIRTGRAKSVLDAYNNSLQLQIKNEILLGKIKEAMKKLDAAENGEFDLGFIDKLKVAWEGVKGFFGTGASWHGSLFGTVDPGKAQGAAEGMAKAVRRAQQDIIDETKETIRLLTEERNAVNELFSFRDPEPSRNQGKRDEKESGGYTSDNERKKAETERKARVAEQRREEAEKERIRKEADKKERAETALKLTQLVGEYSKGNILYSEFIEERSRITLEGIQARKKLWDVESSQYQALLREEEEATQRYDKAMLDKRQGDLRRNYEMEQAQLKAFFNDRNSEYYQNEDALNEALFVSEMSYLSARLSLAKKGSEEYLDLQDQMGALELQHAAEQQEYYLQTLSQMRSQYGKEDLTQQQKLAENGLQALLDAGYILKDEYDSMMQEMTEQYRQRKAEMDALKNGPGSRRRDMEREANTMLNEARAAAGDADDPRNRSMFGGIKSAIENYRNVNEQLKILYGDDETNHAAYLAAKEQNEREFLSSVVSQTQAAYDMINSVVSAASSYAQACSDLETTKISKDYEKQIAAAGNNSKKREKLEKERDEKLREAKTKANQRAMKIELAQAFASTAMAAINAYADAPAPHIIWGPIAAGMATAAGMLQIATIKKQHQAEQAGYYEGGFTGGSQYRREAGAVHQGEFVVNHEGVNNTSLMPALRLIDEAQRHNTVGSLTAQDVSRALGSVGQATVVSAPTVNVQTDNSELRETLDDTRAAFNRLSEQLDKGIPAYMDTESAYKALKHFENLKHNR